MDRTLSSFLLGGCVFGTTLVAQRLIAPYAGLTLTLQIAVLAAALLGLAAGMLAGSARAPGDGSGPAAARALFVAAALTLLSGLLRKPLLVALGALELRLTVAIASALFVLLPCAAIGFAFAQRTEASDARALLQSLAAALLGAVVGAPVFALLLVPQLGLLVSAAVIAGLEALAAGAREVKRAPVPTLLGVLVVGAAAFTVATRPVQAARYGPTLLEKRMGTRAEWRMFDRDGARYLLADGSIHAVVDTLTGDGVQRAPAALELLQLMRPGRDSMLVVGVRGGVLPLQFARNAGWHVRVVEPDSDAVAISSKLSFKPRETELEAMDARRYLRTTDRRFGAIVFDAFADAGLPWTLATRECVADAAKRLTPDGVLVYIVEAHGWGDPFVGSLGATLRTAFPHVVAMPTSEPQTSLGTVLVYASQQPLPWSDEQLPEMSQFFMNPSALWNAQQLTHAWLNRYEPQPANASAFSDDRTAIDVHADRLNHAARAELHRFFGPDGGSW